MIEDPPPFLSTTCPPEPWPFPLEHTLGKTADGTIICFLCGLVIPPPPDMPDYSGAAMGDW